MATLYLDTTSSFQTSPFIPILSATISKDVRNFSPEINLDVLVRPGLSIPDKPGYNRTFYYMGQKYDMKVTSVNHTYSDGLFLAKIGYTSVASDLLKLAPYKPIRFMTVDPDAYVILYQELLTRVEELDYVPYPKLGSQFGSYGWRFYEILDMYATLMVSSGLPFEPKIETNIPDFWVKSFNIESTFFDALLDLVKHFKPEYFFHDETLYILTSGTNTAYTWGGTLKLKSATSVGLVDSDFQPPKLIRVNGGIVPFDKTLWRGKKSAQQELQYFPLELGNPRDMTTLNLPNNNTKYLGDPVTGVNNPIIVYFFSYGEPFVISHREVRYETAPPQLVDTLQKLEDALPDSSGRDLSNFLITGQVIKVEYDIFTRTFFDEPGPKVYHASYEFIDKYFISDKPPEKDVEGDLSGGISEKTAEEYNYVYWLKFSEDFHNFGLTTDVKYEEPMLISGNTLIEYAAKNNLNLETGLQPTGFLKWIAEAFDWVREAAEEIYNNWFQYRWVEPGLLPSEITIEFAHMPTNTFSETGSVSKMMPKKVSFNYVGRQPFSTMHNVRGDTLIESTVEHAQVYTLWSDPSKKFTLEENDMDFKARMGFVSPAEYRNYDEHDLDLSSPAYLWQDARCLVRRSTTTYEKLNHHFFSKKIDEIELRNETGGYVTKRGSVTEQGRLPNNRLKFRGMPYYAEYNLGTAESPILSEPPYVIDLNNLVSVEDINTALEVLKDVVFLEAKIVSLAFNYEFPIDIGWKIIVPNGEIKVPTPPSASPSTGDIYTETNFGSSNVIYRLTDGADALLTVKKVSVNKSATQVTTMIEAEYWSL